VRDIRSNKPSREYLMEDGFVIAHVFQHEYEARLFMLKLEDAGIESFIADHLVVAANPLFVDAVGGIKVRIRTSDIEKALPVIEEYKQVEFENSHIKSETITVGKSKFESYPAYCPKCGSEKVYIQKLGALKAIIAIVSLNFYLPGLYNNNFYCLDCEENWSE